ncbi:hypothetical protein J7J83_00020 [bacterium]|nr:hypothetical protein [bacterium]
MLWKNILNKFPFKDSLEFSSKTIQKASSATLLLGKLDGITQLLPDLDFFLFMYVCKDVASSSQIEGTASNNAYKVRIWFKRLIILLVKSRELFFGSQKTLKHGVMNGLKN